MSLGNIVALLGAGMSGYMKGKQQKTDADAAAQDQEFRQWQHGQMQAQAARDDALRGDLTAAGQPVAMQANMTKPATMDDSDVGQVGEQPVAPNTFNVGSQQFTDQGEAQKAAVAANTPQALAQRIGTAYTKNGQPGMALQAQMQSQQAELTKLGLDKAHLDAANEMYDRALGQQATHQALAQYISNAVGDGQGGALKVKAVPSADGKSVTYSTINPDGSVTPTGHTYTNDDNGVQQAQMWLSRSTPLAEKIRNVHQQFTDNLAAQKEASEAGERKAHADYFTKMADAAGIKAEKTGAGKVPLFDRMDESDKLEFNAAQKASQDADNLINKGVAEGTMKKGDDSFNFLSVKKAAADLRARNVLQRYAGDSGSNPMADPAGIRGGSKGGMAGAADQATRDADAGRLIIDNEFGGDVVKAQAYVAARRAEAATANGDAKQIMNSEADRIQRGIDARKTPAAAAPSPAPADPTARRVTQTPVIDFNPKSGSNARVTAAASRIPALTAAVEAAKQKVQDAKGKGPMAVAAARDQWNNAKTALAEANLRAGNTVADENN